MAFTDDFKLGLNRAMRIVKLERPAIVETAGDANAFTIGLVIVALAGVAQGIGSLLLMDPLSIFIAPVMQVVVSFILIGLWYLIGMIFFKAPTWDFGRLYRTIAHGWILYWVTIIPIVGVFISVLSGIWLMVVAVVVIETIGGLDRTKAVLTVLIPVLLCCVIGAIVAAISGAALMALIGQAAGTAR